AAVKLQARIFPPITKTSVARVAPFVFSERILHGKLNQPWVDGHARNLSERTWNATGRSRVAELWMVERVEKFRAELECCILAQPSYDCVLCQGDVPVLLARPPKYAE